MIRPKQRSPHAGATRLHNSLVLVSVLLLLIGLFGFWDGYIHRYTKVVAIPTSCGTGYPEPTCDSDNEFQYKQVRAWKQEFYYPIGAGVVGVVVLYGLEVRSRIPSTGK